jgi:hypothetical protein
MARIRLATTTPAVTTGSAYANGNVIGGALTFLNIQDGGFSCIYSMTVTDQNAQNASIDLLLFNKPFTSTITDKTAISLNAADLVNCLGVISIVAADYSNVGAGSIAGKSGKLNLFLGIAGGIDDNIYGVMVIRGGSPNYSVASALTVNIVAEQVNLPL